MAAKWYELITGSLDDKKAYRQYKARIAALPEPYGTAAKAFERYFMYNGGITDGDSAVMLTMLNDFADLWERAHEIAAGIARKPSAATQGTVRAIWESLDRPYRAAMEQGLIYTRLGNLPGLALVIALVIARAVNAFA